MKKTCCKKRSPLKSFLRRRFNVKWLWGGEHIEIVGSKYLSVRELSPNVPAKYLTMKCSLCGGSDLYFVLARETYHLLGISLSPINKHEEGAIYCKSCDNYLFLPQCVASEFSQIIERYVEGNITKEQFLKQVLKLK
jgi:hypothetical protein